MPTGSQIVVVFQVYLLASILGFYLVSACTSLVQVVTITFMCDCLVVLEHFVFLKKWQKDSNPYLFKNHHPMSFKEVMKKLMLTT